MRFTFILLVCLLLLPVAARAEFNVSSAIIEFKGDGPAQNDISLISRSKDTDYIDTEISEIVDPGLPTERRQIVTDPAAGRLLVTPDKTVLASGSRKVLRFVLLKSPDAKEHIYRVAIKPVIKGVKNDTKVGLKVLVGYEVLVIVRPASQQPSYNAQRSGDAFTVTNSGNTNILFQNGQQCRKTDDCVLAPVVRVYPDETITVRMPLNAPVVYTVWDGTTSDEKTFN